MKVAHIYIYGIIDYCQDEMASEYGYVNLKSVKNQLDNQAGFDEIKVHIHSEGGDVTEGFAIHDFLKSQGKPITSIVEGMCASIATVVALAGDTRQMTSNSTFFIHNPWGFAGGEKDALRKYADELEAIETKLSNFYAGFSNLSQDQLLDYMKVETSFTANQAVDFGFMTEIVETVKAVALLKKENFKNADMSYTKTELDEKFNKSEGILNKILNMITGKNKPKALLVQNATGDEVDFTDLEEGDEPKVGDKATLNGSPIPDGEHIFPSLKNVTIKFVGGEVSEIVEETEEIDAEALTAENANLKAELETLKAQNSTQASNLTAATEAIKNLKTEFTDLKKSVGSSYNYKAEKNGNQEEQKNQSGVTRTPLKK